MKYLPCKQCGSFDSTYHYSSCGILQRVEIGSDEADMVWTKRDSCDVWDFDPVGSVQVFANGTAAYWFTKGEVAKAVNNEQTAMDIIESAQCGHVLAVHYSGGGTISCTITTDGGEYEHDILNGASEDEYKSAKKAWEGASVRMIEGKLWVRI